MEKIKAHPLLEFTPDIIEVIRNEYNLDKPGQMDAAIDLLDHWIKKQAHFTKNDFSRDYLERSIIFVKGSTERAKVQLDKLFTMKTAMPHFFEKTNPKTDFADLSKYYTDALLPKLTKDHYRIYAGKIRCNGFTTNDFTLTYQFGILICEHIKSNDYCSGIVAILDYRGINLLEVVAQINILELKQFMSFVTEGYQMRVKGIHLVTSSKAVELLVKIFKQILSKKIGDRIQVHPTVESLHNYVPKELLTSDLGGDLNKTLVDLNRDWIELLSTEENIKLLKEMNKAKVKEELRNGVDKSKEDLLGLPGSFRTLVVD